MIDFARITARAGNGGNGCGSFHKIKGKRYGRADGGDGGSGGNVYIEATGDLNTLEKYRYLKEYKAEGGGGGLSNHRRGADGEDLVLKVPVGTVVKATTDYGVQTTAVDSRQWTVDLIDDNQRVLVARGGESGRGNMHLRDELGRRPRFGEVGQEGEICQLTLELKLIADVGLIGLPNAGKSTLLAALTAARPAIAPYPFTTLEPNLGVLTFSGPVTSFPPASARLRENSNLDQKSMGELRAVGSPSSGATRKSSLVLADIPGLIEGASGGKGLGDLFLRHIERTKVLVHLVDVTTGTDKWQDYQIVRGELKAYSGELVKKPEIRELISRKPEIIVLTKADLVEAKMIERAREEFRRHRKKTLVISAARGEGLSELARAIAKATAKQAKQE